MSGFGADQGAGAVAADAPRSTGELGKASPIRRGGRIAKRIRSREPGKIVAAEIGGRVQRRLASLLFREDVVYVGPKTGRDGIHGATLASAEFDDRSDEKRPTARARSDIEGAPDFSDRLPAFVIKAREDARARRALARSVWVFVGTMVATVVAGLGMFVVLR